MLHFFCKNGHDMIIVTKSNCVFYSIWKPIIKLHSIHCKQIAITKCIYRNNRWCSNSSSYKTNANILVHLWLMNKNQWANHANIVFMFCVFFCDLHLAKTKLLVSSKCCWANTLSTLWQYAGIFKAETTLWRCVW